MLKIIDCKLPTDVITTIERHLEKAETKHPDFAEHIIPTRIVTQSPTKLLKEARDNRDKTKSVFDILEEEFYEIFEALSRSNLIDARMEIYDTIAVLLRLDKVLQSKQQNEDFLRNDIPIVGNN